ncbi:hypothetical protein CDD81_4664 [Ophiocordyceps australis]|uniref:Uncharacterized protein n=1 Tax=Ophiocordyceps australis TaxID=1399860 RepID=A0A2C5XDN3_9HYPO|nr:hypothetical protein CDD81_4664 [Ophiocordyceps australis]
MAAANAALEDALQALNFHWEINRVLFDRILKTLTWRKKQDMPEEDQSLQVFDQIIQNVHHETGQPHSINSLPRQATIVAQALRAVIQDLESSRTETKDKQATPPSIVQQVDKIEQHRRIIRILYLRLRKHIKDLQQDIKDMGEFVTDPEAIGKYKRTMRSSQGLLLRAKEKAMLTDDIKTIYKCLEDSIKAFTGAKNAASTIAQTIQDSKKLTTQDFTEVREILYDMRKGISIILAKETSHFIKEFIVEKWQGLDYLRTNREAMEQEVSYLNELALYSHGNAIKLGEDLQDKANNLNVIKNLIAHPKLTELSYDAETALTLTRSIWLQGVEDPQAALQFERRALEEEIRLTQGPIHAYVTTSLIIQKEAELTAAILDYSISTEDAELQRLKWRQKSISQLIDSLRKDVQEEKSQKAKINMSNKKETLESAAAAENLKDSQELSISLGMDIANAVLAAIPSPITPIADVLIWARQAIRIRRFLRSLVRSGSVPEHLVTQTHAVTGSLQRAMGTWRTKVPDLMGVWASDKTPQQILDGLSQIQEDDLLEAENESLRTSQEPAQQEPPQQAPINVEEEPLTREPKEVVSEKSIDELMQELENIHIPEEEPGDNLMEKPLSKMLKRLVRHDIPVTAPGRSASKVKVKVPAERARRSIRAIREDLQEAARIPHHSSDVDFKQLLDDAGWYLPDDCDIKPQSMGMSIVATIREGAVAAAA